MSLIFTVSISLSTTGFFPKLIASGFTFGFCIGDQDIGELQNIFFTVDIRKRIIVHGFLEIDRIQDFDPILTVVFAVFYGIVSFYFRYYGEVLTYLGMSAPSAIAAVISWMRHPYEGTKEVKVNKVTGKLWVLLIFMTAVVTLAFYYILSAMPLSGLVYVTEPFRSPRPITRCRQLNGERHSDRGGRAIRLSGT